MLRISIFLKSTPLRFPVDFFPHFFPLTWLIPSPSPEIPTSYTKRPIQYKTPLEFSIDILNGRGKGFFLIKPNKQWIKYQKDSIQYNFVYEHHSQRFGSMYQHRKTIQELLQILCYSIHSICQSILHHGCKNLLDIMYMMSHFLLQTLFQAHKNMECLQLVLGIGYCLLTLYHFKNK